MAASSRVPLALQYEAALEKNSQRRMVTKRRCLSLLTDGDIRCQWCGIDDMDVLTIDHVHDDGAEDRKSHRSTLQLQYAILSGKKDRSRYQVLCANCNMKKALQSHKNGSLRRRTFTPRYTLQEIHSVRGMGRSKAAAELGCGYSTYVRHLLYFGLDSHADDDVN